MTKDIDAEIYQPSDGSINRYDILALEVKNIFLTFSEEDFPNFCVHLLWKVGRT